DVPVLDRMGDRIGVQLMRKQIFSDSQRLFGPINLLFGGVIHKNRRTGKAEQLGVGEELLDGLVILTELGAVAFIENEDQALVPQGREAFAVIALVGPVKRQTKLLYGRDDRLVRLVFGQ